MVKSRLSPKHSTHDIADRVHRLPCVLDVEFPGMPALGRARVESHEYPSSPDVDSEGSTRGEESIGDDIDSDVCPLFAAVGCVHVESRWSLHFLCSRSGRVKS